MDSDRWPDLDALKRLLDAVSDFRGMDEGGALALEQRALGRLEGRMSQPPSGPG